MPALVFISLMLLALVIAGIWVTFSLLGVVVMLVVAGIVGWVADRVVPGELPYGWLGAIAAGLLGSWLGSLLIGRVGPRAGGIPIFPALLGAIILAFAYDLLQKRLSRDRL